MSTELSQPCNKKQKRDVNNFDRDESPSSLWYERLHQLTPQYFDVKSTKEISHFDGIVATHGENKEHVLAYNSTADPSLKRWIVRQRERYKKRNLNMLYIDLLNQINFIWNVREYVWNTRLNELKQFHEEHGDCKVPPDYQHFPKLGSWQINLRRTKKKQEKDTPKTKGSRLTKDQMSALDDLNIDLDVDDGMWLVMFNKLKGFYDTNGHTHVTKTICADEFGCLGGESALNMEHGT